MEHTEVYILQVEKYSDLRVKDFHQDICECRMRYCLKYRNKKDIVNSMIASVLIKYALISCYGISGTPCITIKSKGCPVIKKENIFVSISHCEDTIAVALCKNKIGIDIESIFKVTDEIITEFMTKSELESYFSSDIKPIFRTLIWTKKESYSKFLGVGFYKNPKEINISSLNKSNFFSTLKNGKILTVYASLPIKIRTVRLDEILKFMDKRRGPNE